MIDHFCCPVCQEQDWRVLGTRTYQGNDQPHQRQYVRKRLEVLFKIWLVNVSEVTFGSVLCQQCGFVCHTPRPTEDEVSAKYEFLSRDPATHHEISRDLESDGQRSRNLLALLTSYIRPQAQVLDFGGGNGRLMSAFIEAGHNCHLVDFPGNPISGIIYLGSDLAAIDDDQRFDLVILSHVLEHLVDPAKTVREVRRLVVPGGLLYVEVPLEIWKQPPLPEEPVTHINYFTEDSVRILLERANYRVARCETGTYTTEDGGLGLAIRAFARPDDKASLATDYAGCCARTLRLVNPGLRTQLTRALRYPELLKRDLDHAIARWLTGVPLLWRFAPGKKQN